MIPAVRAVADRFILDTANVKYVAANLPAGSLERIVEETGWTIRQTLAHVAVSLENYANALKWLVEGVEPDRTGRYPWPRNAEVAPSRAISRAAIRSSISVVVVARSYDGAHPHSFLARESSREFGHESAMACRKSGS